MNKILKLTLVLFLICAITAGILGGMNELTPTKLFPLKGRKIILFPDTDEEGLAYSNWYKICQESQRLLGHPIYLSPLLEQRASPSQKRRKIDILDYYFETINPLTSHH